MKERIKVYRANNNSGGRVTDLGCFDLDVYQLEVNGVRQHSGIVTAFLDDQFVIECVNLGGVRYILKAQQNSARKYRDITIHSDNKFNRCQHCGMDVGGGK